MKKSILVVVLVALCCMVIAPAVASAAQSEYQMKSEATIKNILLDNINKRVTVRMATGESLEGIVTKVGDTLVHVSKITGKEFYDAIIRMDAINSVVFRAREQ